jgi:hypothetical protein
VDLSRLFCLDLAVGLAALNASSARGDGIGVSGDRYECFGLFGKGFGFAGDGEIAVGR